MINVPTTEEFNQLKAELEAKIAALGDSTTLKDKVTAIENQLSAAKEALKTLNESFNGA